MIHSIFYNSVIIQVVLKVIEVQYPLKWLYDGCYPISYSLRPIPSALPSWTEVMSVSQTHISCDPGFLLRISSLIIPIKIDAITNISVAIPGYDPTIKLYMNQHG